MLVDEQLDDATRLLEDPAHAPGLVLSDAEIDALEANFAHRTKRPQRLFDKALYALLFAALMGLILLTVYEFILEL